MTGDDDLRVYLQKRFERAMVDLVCAGGIDIGGGCRLVCPPPPPEINTIEKAFDWIESHLPRAPDCVKSG